MIGYDWDPTASMRNLNSFLVDAAKNKLRVHQLDFIGEFLQANVKHRVFVKLDSRYGEYFPEYDKYFGGPWRPKKALYVMNNYGGLFDDELINWMIDESDFNQYKCQIYVHYKYCVILC